MRKSSKGRGKPSDHFFSLLGNEDDEELDTFIHSELDIDGNNTNPGADLSHEQLDKLWAILLRIFESHQDKILSETHSNDRELSGNQNVATTEKSKQNVEERSYTFVKAIIKKMQDVVSEADAYIPESMINIMIGLQRFLVTTVHDVDVKFKDMIVHLIELWSKAKLELKASMILLAFQFLLASTSVTVKIVKKNNIRRIWNFRDTLLKLQLTSIGCQDLLNTLSALPANSRFLKSKDGCHFITFLFTINEVLISNLHESVKQVLPTVKHSDAEAYGKIYTNAWIKSTPEIRSVIEETCVQNFMVHIFTIQRQGQEMSRLGQNILAILNQFHRYTPFHPLMQKMLTDQYEPLLWRFLVSPNNLHRCNATQVFFSAYPLRCPGSGAQARVMFEEKQHAAIQSMLVDSCHLIRIIAVKEAFAIMEQYWQSLPPECTQKWTKVIVTELAVDSSCADIRKHVFLGFACLLNNVYSFGYVKEVLPQLRILIHDINEKVRLAFINLLLKVKNCGMTYWTFVPLRHLIARLEVEDALVGEKIVQLLYDGFCGSNKSIEQKVRRIMTLFTLSSGAGRNFFYYSKPTMGKDSAVNLISVILQSVKLFVKTCLEQDKTLDSSICSTTDCPVQDSRKGKHADKENIDTANTLSPSKTKNNIHNRASLENPIVLWGFLDTVCILWTLYITELSEDEMKRLHNLCAECIPSFMSFFKGTDLYSSVLYLSSLVPSKTHTQNFHIISSLLSQVKVLTNDDDEDSFMALVQPLCSWDRAADLIELVQESLHVVFSSKSASQHSRNSARKQVTFHTANDLTPGASLQVLNAMFGYQPNQKKVLRKNYEQLIHLWTEMAAIKDFVRLRVIGETPLENPVLTDSFLQDCMTRYAKLIPILKNDKSDFNYCQEFIQLLDWARDKLVPHIPKELPSTSSTSSIPFVVSVLRDLENVAVQSLLCGLHEPKFYMHIAAFSKQLLKSGCGLMFLSSTSSVIAQLLTMSKMPSEEKDSMRLLRIVIPSLITADLSVLSQCNYSHNCIAAYVENFSSVKGVMSDVLMAIKSSYGVSSELFVCVTEKFVDAIVISYDLFLQEMENEDLAKTVNNLPYVTSQLIGIFICNASFRMVLVEALRKYLESTTEDDPKLMAVDTLIGIAETVQKTQLRLSRPSRC